MTLSTSGKDQVIPMRTLMMIALVASALFNSATARADECASLSLPDWSENVVIGEAGYERCLGGPVPTCFFMPYSTPKLGVCWQGPSGAWHLEVLDCDIHSKKGDVFWLETNGGDDRVAVLRPEHTKGDRRLLPAGAGLGAMRCNGSKLISPAYSPGALAPWHPDFKFGIVAFLGEGTDLFHGSDNQDIVFTNEISYVNWTSPADFSSADMVCTYGGDDVIYGDGDDDFASGFEDWFDGGAGEDLCIGDYGFDGNSVSDLHRNCEIARDAHPDLPYVDLVHCSDSANPLRDWGLELR